MAPPPVQQDCNADLSAGGPAGSDSTNGHRRRATVAPTAVRTGLTEPTIAVGIPRSGVPAPVGEGAAPVRQVRAAVTRLVGSDVDAFAGEHWGTAPLFHATADCKRFADLFDLDAVDELLSCRGLRTPFLRLARNGSVIDSTDFTGLAEVGDQVRLARWRHSSPTPGPRPANSAPHLA